MTPRRRKKHKPEQIVANLRDADAMRNAGKDLAAVLRALEISETTLARRRAQYGGMKSEEAKRLKALEDESPRLKQLLPPRSRPRLQPHPRLSASVRPSPEPSYRLVREIQAVQIKKGGGRQPSPPYPAKDHVFHGLPRRLAMPAKASMVLGGPSRAEPHQGPT